MTFRLVLIAGLVASSALALGDGLAASSSHDGSPNRVLGGERGAGHARPGPDGLVPALLGALRRAAIDADHAGLRLRIVSGRRTAAHQARLFREAIAEHGSAAEAARWVAPPDRSAHVSGDAVDIGPAEAAAWLSAHGAAYGLCQVYGNEPWHFELRPEASDRGCPERYPDPTYDPRLRG